MVCAGGRVVQPGFREAAGDAGWQPSGRHALGAGDPAAGWAALGAALRWCAGRPHGPNRPRAAPSAKVFRLPRYRQYRQRASCRHTRRRRPIGAHRRQHQRPRCSRPADRRACHRLRICRADESLLRIDRQRFRNTHCAECADIAARPAGGGTYRSRGARTAGVAVPPTIRRWRNQAYESDDHQCCRRHLPADQPKPAGAGGISARQYQRAHCGRPSHVWDSGQQLYASAARRGGAAGHAEARFPDSVCRRPEWAPARARNVGGTVRRPGFSNTHLSQRSPDATCEWRSARISWPRRPTRAMWC
jgi:hypothetical protein